MNRVAQGLSLQTVVVAVLVIVVLIILIVVFSGKMNLFGEGTDECSTKGGQCQNNPCTTGYASVPNAKCPADQTYCCIPL